MIVLVAVACAGVVGVAAFATFGGASNSPTAASYYRALRRPLGARDRALAGNAHFQRFANSQPASYQAEPRQARVVYEANGVLVTLMPAGSGGFCDTATISDAHGALEYESGDCSYGPRTTADMNDSPILGREGFAGRGPWVGILPDGVSSFRMVYADGTATVVRLNTDRAFVVEPAKAVSRFTFTDSKGRARALANGPPPRS